MKGINEQTKRLIQGAEQLGYNLVGRTAKNHLRFWHPQAGACFFSGTPSDHRAIHNCLSQMRRKLTLKGDTCEKRKS